VALPGLELATLFALLGRDLEPRAPEAAEEVPSKGLHGVEVVNARMLRAVGCAIGEHREITCWRTPALAAEKVVAPPEYAESGEAGATDLAVAND